MNRWLVAALVLLAVIILVSPGIVGRLAEKNLHENIEWVSSENPDVSISTERFDRGWFTSEGRHRVVFTGSAFHDATTLNGGNAGLPALIIDTRIDHGLLPLTSMSRESGSLLPGLANTISTFQVDTGSGEPISLPGTLYSDIGLTGTSESRFLLQPGSFSENALSATWQGADLLVVSNPASGSLSVTGSIEPFSVTDNGNQVAIGSINIDASETRSEYEFNVGHIEVEMQSLSTDKANGPFSMGALALSANTNIAGSRLNGAATFSMQDVVVPGMGNVELAMDFSMQRLDAVSFQALTTALRQAEAEYGAEAALQAVYPEIEDDLQKLVSTGAQFRFDRFDITLPQGKVTSSLMLEFAELDADEPFSWSMVLLAMTAALDMRVPVELYEIAQMMNPQAESLIAMGILKRDGDDYVLVAEYAQGLLNVNGAPMPIPLPTM